MPRYRITAEHSCGKSVSHPCVDGVYCDPTDDFQTDVEARDESEAERMGLAELLALADAAEPCKCRRHLSPGSDAWVGSVALSVVELSGAEQ